MFTGLVEEVGTIRTIVRRRGSLVFSIEGKRSAAGLRVMESVAVNGVCLTVIRKKGRLFDVQAVEETLRKTNLGMLKVGDGVNLERALLPSERLGGHFVLGHVDCTARVRRRETRGSSWMFWFEVPKRYRKYLIPVGSVAVDGVSLTVAALRDSVFGVSIIPYTMEHTTFGRMREGERVNIEFDVLGKYVERILKSRRR